MSTKKKDSTKPMGIRSYVAVVATVLVLFFLGRQGYLQQQPGAAGTSQMGLTPGAVQLFADSPSVYPLGRADVPVGVLKINGVTYAIYPVTNKNDQPR